MLLYPQDGDRIVTVDYVLDGRRDLSTARGIFGGEFRPSESMVKHTPACMYVMHSREPCEYGLTRLGPCHHVVNKGALTPYDGSTLAAAAAMRPLVTAAVATCACRDSLSADDVVSTTELACRAMSSPGDASNVAPALLSTYLLTYLLTSSLAARCRVSQREERRTFELLLLSI